MIEYNPLLNFYSNQAAHPKGYTIDKVLSWNFDQLEDAHDYIQWAFPLKEVSQYNNCAPLLTDHLAHTFSHNDEIRAKVYAMFSKMLDFYGLFWSGKHDTIKYWPQHLNGLQMPQFRLNTWVTPHNHNFLRITRIIKSMKLLGFEHDALGLQRCALEIADAFPEVIDAETREYWEEAI